MFDYPKAELVFGIVSAVGTDCSSTLSFLFDLIRKAGYAHRTIRISDQLEAVAKKLQIEMQFPALPEYDRVTARMDAGNAIRERTGRDDFMALIAASLLHSERKGRAVSSTTAGIASGVEPQAAERTVHLLDSLKRPEEVDTLRKIYGSGFFLIGIFASEQDRLSFLSGRKSMKEKAHGLIERDSKESVPHGQRTRDTFELADVFVSSRAGEFDDGLTRFISIVFGSPHTTPTRDEQAMFMAYSASLRSGSLARQVGSAIFSKEGDLLAVGCNDVPRPRGGLYCAGDPNDARDSVKGFDSNDATKQEILADTIALVRQATASLREATNPECDFTEFDKKFDENISGVLRRGKMMEITEFGRDVHAEMEAILSCARVGVSPRGGTLYATTFPCHNCARHILAAGIEKVIYIEPYPKSKAPTLHADGIAVVGDVDSGAEGGRIRFEPFVGIGPRRFFDLFSLKLSSGYAIERKENGKRIEWALDVNAKPRLPMPPTSYIQREQMVLRRLADIYDNERSQKNG